MVRLSWYWTQSVNRHKTQRKQKRKEGLADRQAPFWGKRGDVCINRKKNVYMKTVYNKQGKNKRKIMQNFCFLLYFLEKINKYFCAALCNLVNILVL